MIKKLVLAAALLVLALPAAAQQSFGLINPGTVLGNSTAAARTPTQTQIPALFDRALCNTVGGVLVRSTTGWICGSIVAPMTVNTTTGALSVTTPTTIANGGTSQITAPLARSSVGLNIDSFTGFGNTNTPIAATDRVAGTNAAFTASRTWTLPAANAVNAGQSLVVADFQGTVTSTNTLVIARAGADTINGATSVTINGANGAFILISDGISKWSASPLYVQYVRLDLAGQVITGGATVTSLTQSTGNITVDCGLRPLQFITNGGAFTITAPANDGACMLLVTNNASAGAITFSGFSVGANTGDILTTVNTSKFMVWIGRINGSTTYRIASLQ